MESKSIFFLLYLEYHIIPTNTLRLTHLLKTQSDTVIYCYYYEFG